MLLAANKEYEPGNFCHTNLRHRRKIVICMTWNRICIKWRMKALIGRFVSCRQRYRCRLVVEFHVCDMTEEEDEVKMLIICSASYTVLVFSVC